MKLDIGLILKLVGLWILIKKKEPKVTEKMPLNKEKEIIEKVTQASTSDIPVNTVPSYALYEPLSESQIESLMAAREGSDL